MRKLFSFIIIASVLFALSGCGMSQKPNATIAEFIEATKTYDIEKMASKMNPSNSADKQKLSDLTKDEKDEFQKYFIDYLKSNATKITYKIKNTKIDNDTAVVTVNFKYVDGAPLIKATVAEVFSKAIPLAFAGVEMSEEEKSQLFVTAMQEQSKTIVEKFAEATIDIKCTKINNQWYINEPSEAFWNVITSNFISAGKEIDKSFNSSKDTSEKTPKEMISDINNYVISDLWNEGFIDVDCYLETGKGASGQDLDIELTKSQLSKAIKKKTEYDQYINNLGEEYTELKSIWTKLSAEADKLYAQIERNATSLNTDIFSQYMYVFSDEVNKLD